MPISAELIEEYKQKRAKIEQMASPEAIEKRHAEGQLTDQTAAALLRDVERLAKMAELQVDAAERVKIQKAITIIKDLIFKLAKVI